MKGRTAQVRVSSLVYLTFDFFQGGRGTKDARSDKHDYSACFLHFLVYLVIMTIVEHFMSYKKCYKLSKK